MRRAVLLCVLATAACGDDSAPRDKVAECRAATATSAATVQDRKAIGVAAPYHPDLGLAARDGEFRGSIAARRAAAWQVVQRVLSPVPLADPNLAANFGGAPIVPAWDTWYARDDFDRIFKHLYRALTPAERAARAPIDAAAGLAWDTNALDELDDWPESRYLDYLSDVQTQAEAAGLGGVYRVAYSPGAMQHLEQSYAKQYACRLAAEPPAVDPQPTRDELPVSQAQAATVEACGFQVLGPFLAGHGPVDVALAGDGDGDLYVRRGSAPDTETFDCRSDGDTSDEHCTVDGDGPIYVGVFASKPSTVKVTVAYAVQDAPDPVCLDGAMPRDAVLVKADWRRSFVGETMPTFDTSGARMAQRLAGEATWNADGAADPQSDSIYTVQIPSGATFRLPGLHIMSKELDHWMWISLWYSPDPDTDFGADRPAAIGALPGPWRNYKMCVSSSYIDADPDPRGGQAGTLGDAYAAVHAGGAGGPTWCSNPYIEDGAGNASTNCIGCHQHGGTALTAEGILDNEPLHGVTRLRNNFMTDYTWAIKGGGGEDLSSIIQAEIEYWDAND